MIIPEVAPMLTCTQINDGYLYELQVHAAEGQEPIRRSRSAHTILKIISDLVPVFSELERLADRTMGSGCISLPQEDGPHILGNRHRCSRQAGLHCLKRRLEPWDTRAFPVCFPAQAGRLAGGARNLPYRTTHGLWCQRSGLSSIFCF